MIYCFDIDGTLCTNTDGEYRQAQAFPEVIVQVNQLYEQGHRIILYTARGSTTGIDWRKVTEEQMKLWGVKYHELFFGKPTADLYIDDKAVHIKDWKASAQVPKTVLETSAYLEVTYDPKHTPYGKYPSQLAQWLLKNVYHTPGSLLDMGCGRGEHLAALNHLGFQVTGLDLSPIASTLTKDFPIHLVNLEQDPLPIPQNSFDYILSKSVIEHMQHPHSLFSKALEALRPGGTAVIMTPSWAHTYWGPFYIDSTHVTPFTAPSLSTAMTVAGFEQVAVSHFYQLPFLWKYPVFMPLVKLIAQLPLPYRPFQSAPWSESFNKLLRFSKEVMLLGVGRKPL